MDFFCAFEDVVSKVEDLAVEEVDGEFYRKINPSLQSGFVNRLKTFCDKYKVQLHIYEGRGVLYFGDFVVDTDLSDKHRAVMDIWQNLRRNGFKSEIRQCFENTFKHLFSVGYSLLPKDVPFGVSNLRSEYEELLADEDADPPFEDNNWMIDVEKNLERRRIDSILDPVSQAKSKPLMCLDDDSNYTKFCGLEVSGKIAHVGSGGHNSWSTVALMEKGDVVPFDPIYGTTHEDVEPGDFDYVVSNACLYDSKGMLAHQTNVLNRDIIDRCDGRVKGIFLKLALFSIQSVALFEGVLFRPIKRMRMHNQELIVEVCQHVIGLDGRACSCIDYPAVCRKYKRQVQRAHNFRVRYGMIRSSAIARCLSYGRVYAFNPMMHRVRPSRARFGGIYVYHPYETPLERSLKYVTLSDLLPIFGFSKAKDRVRLGPREIIEFFLSIYEFEDAIPEILRQFQLNGYSYNCLL
jgi:hypothetical protein